MNILQTPFKIPTNHEYPPCNKVIFEEYFYHWIMKNRLVTKKTYLPIFWTNYYISKDYATKDITAINEFLDTIDPNNKYFTIIQWDDGIVNPFYYNNIYVYGQGGGGEKKGFPGHYAIPLNCQSEPKNKQEKKDIFASFIGVIFGRNNLIRETLFNILSNKKGYLLHGPISYQAFSHVMSKSIFALCPRGYGATSFRICEALQHGSIPVYISDKPWFPFHDLIEFNDYGVFIPPEKIELIDDILSSINPERILQLNENGRIIYQKYFSYEGCSEQIYKHVNEN